MLRGDDRTWALAERIGWASETAAADRASEALRLARLAVRLAEGCPGPEAWCLRVRGWCEPILANALRVGGDLPASAAQFASADELWRQGEGGDPAGLLDGLRRLDLKASLFMYQEEHFEEAQALLDEALKGTTDDQARARLLIKKATALEISGDYDAALGVLDQAEPLIGEQSGSRNLFLHHFMKAVNLCHLDLFETGSVLVPVVEQLAADSGNELDQVRVRWLRGRTLVGLGRRAEALAALTEVRAYLHAERIAYDFALVSLEVAVAHLEQGQLPRVQELAEEMLWIFHDQGVHKEALAALTLFCQAAKAGEVEVAWTRRLIKYLYRAQYSPGLRFEP